MITIGSLLEQYGLTARDIRNIGTFGNDLAEAYAVSHNYVRFTSDFLKAFPGTPRGAANYAFKLARYFYEAGQILSQLDPSQVIPTYFANVQQKATETLGLFAPYNYTVRTTWQDPRTGTQWSGSIIVSSNNPLSLSQAYDRALQASFLNFVASDPFRMDEDTYSELDFTQELTQFNRYEV